MSNILTNAAAENAMLNVICDHGIVSADQLRERLCGEQRAIRARESALTSLDDVCDERDKAERELAALKLRLPDADGMCEHFGHDWDNDMEICGRCELPLSSAVEKLAGPPQRAPVITCEAWDEEA